MQPYVVGPCVAAVSIGGVPTPLGFCERSPSVQIRPYYSPVFSDFAGQRVPLDLVYDGAEAMISLDLTKYNESTYSALANLPFGPATSNAIGARGTNLPGDIGTLMLHEGCTYDLWLRFPYAAKAVFSGGVLGGFSGGPMPAGYHFRACYLEGPDDLGPLGTTARRLRLNFHAIREFDTSTAGISFFLYDHDMSAVAAMGFA